MQRLERSMSGTNSTGGFKITAKEPSYVEAFYGTSNSQYKGHWHDGTSGTKVGDVPKISDVLGAKPVIRKPVRPLVVTAQTLLADQIKTERFCNLTDKVL